MSDCKGSYRQLGKAWFWVCTCGVSGTKPARSKQEANNFHTLHVRYVNRQKAS